MADAHKNFAVSEVATAPSPASSGTSLVVASGHGTRFPTVPFNASIWPADAMPTPANAEIVRVTGISTDTLTISRAEEGTSARTVIVGDKIAATITAKTLTDVEGWTIVKKTADENVTNSNTLQDDDELTFTMLSSATYAIRCWVYFSSTAVGDIKYGFACPGTPTVTGWRMRMQTNTPEWIPVFALADTASSANVTDTRVTSMMFELYVLNSSGDTTWTFQFAQNVQTADAGVTVYKGSYLEYFKV